MTRIDTLGDWAKLQPDTLRRKAALVAEQIALHEAGKALAYARSEPDASYDDVAHRLIAATPCRGVVPLQTIAQMLIERERDREPGRIRRIRRDHDALRPRALDLPIRDGKARYECKTDTFEFYLERTSEQGVTFEERWIVGRSHPPELLSRDAVDGDAPQTLNQRYRIDLPHAAWVRLSTLVEQGRFLPRQQWEDRLLRRVEAQRLYLFISHRWRTADNPDPDGREAALLTWQLVDHLVEAVQIANRRGLHTPRRSSPTFGFFLGLAGRALSEALIVNVLRPRLAAEELAAAAGEVASLESRLATGVFEMAQADVGLGALRELLRSAPLLQRLAEGVALWYDYSSLPQAPRTPSEETVFRDGLRELSPIQMLGPTAVLIDRPERYLSRAWCTLEAIGAGVSSQDLILLHASPQEGMSHAEVEPYFVRTMSDRHQIVRRAVLDTVLFRVQSSQRCFERLRIELTHAADLDAVFELLRQVSVPPAVHVDGSSVVTGCWPLATGSDGRVVLPVRSPRLEPLRDRDGAPATLDWTGALMLLDACERRVVPAHVEFAPPADGPRAHAIVVGPSEGDAILVAGWTADHRAALEGTIGAAVVWISWLSEDIVPVGHLACGRLEPVLVAADVCVIVGPEALLEHGRLVRGLLAAAAVAGQERVVVVVDSREANVRRLAMLAPGEGEEPAESAALGEMDLRPIDGGIFSAALGRGGVRLFTRTPASEAPERPESQLADSGPAPEQLQVLLINAVFGDKADLLTRLCRSFPRTIVEQFKSWMKVPEELRASPKHVRAYVDAIVRIAQCMEGLGFEGPTRELNSPKDNPIQRWYRMFRTAQEASSSGDRDTAVLELQTVLDEMQGSSGSAIDNLRPKVLGMLSAEHFHAGRIGASREAGLQALDACRRAGDDEGVSIYLQNLQVLDSAVKEEDPAVSLIARAQELSDQGRYDASDAMLERLDLGPDTMVSCKARGLLAANRFWRGDRAAATAHGREAVRVAHGIGDPESMRVYSYNLKRIEGADASVPSKPDSLDSPP